MEPKIYSEKTEDRENFVLSVMKKFYKEIEPRKKIFVKPNIVSFEPYPTTTHPDVLRAVLKFLANKNRHEIIVADAPAPDAGSASKVIKKHDLQKVCNEFDLELKNIYDLGFRTIGTGSGFDLQVSELAFSSDYMISLPVMKAHCMDCIGITGALKNNFGLLAAKDRIILHSVGGLPFRAVRKILGSKSDKPFKLIRKILRMKKDINLAIAELNVIRKPDLFIVDMVDTLINGNEVRHGGIKKHVGLMFAGKDPVALDSFGLSVLNKIDPRLKGKNPEDISHIKYYMMKTGYNKSATK
jgi:uncharacterized protein (DUF362 family)